MADKFDVIIIGSGPGGYVAAIRAKQLGLKIAVVEENHLGGICLNWGCIPTKALLRSSEIYHLLHRLDEFGLSAKDIKFDFKKVVERSRKVADQLSKGIDFLLKKNKIPVIWGRGKIKKPGLVSVENAKDKSSKDYEAKHIIIATGARARDLPGLEADGKLIWSYKQAMTPDKMPKSLLVVGSGAIGSEFASFYKSMGVDVTLVEVQDRVLPVEDAEISAFVEKQFKAQGMKIATKTVLKKVDKQKDHVVAHLEKDGKISKQKFDRVIMAVGIIANTENIGLENTKVKLDKNHIQVNEWLETHEKNIYAIGDVVGAPWLAHKASHEGVICVEKIANHSGAHPLNQKNIPGCTYCHPQVASVGLTEAQAKEKGLKIKVGRFPAMGNGKAIALGEPEGLTKVIFDEKTGELLGAHMVGPEVTEQIQGFVVAKTLETTEQDLMQTIFPHPTLSEMMHEAVLDAYDQVIHI